MALDVSQFYLWIVGLSFIRVRAELITEWSYLSRAASNSRFSCSAQPLSMPLAAARLEVDVAHCILEDPLRR
jgi:hypothetical protein